VVSHKDAFNDDVARFVLPARPPQGVKLFTRVLSEPGLQFAWLIRVQMSFERRGRFLPARLVHLLNLRITGGEFGHGCTVRGGLVVKHPLGVVIGGGTVLGRNCTILHNVTFGERRPEDPGSGVQKYPIVGDDCLIGTSAVVLGPIRIGDGAKVGAGAIVLRDVADGVTVVGSPARPVGIVQP
jgi:serine O-acetyltransferase